MSLRSRSRQLAQTRFWEKYDSDDYQCPDCNRTADEICSDNFEVHHKDGNAFNNSMENLIGLCPLCHNLREGKRPGAKAVKALRDLVISLQNPNSIPQSAQPETINQPSGPGDPDGSGQTTFKHVDRVTTRDQKGSIVIPVQEAIDQSGNAGGNGIFFTRSDELVLTGEVVDERPDGRKHDLARAINRFGSREIKSVALPTPGLDHLDVDRADAADGVELDLWVCVDPGEDRHLIAVTPVIYQEMQFTNPERDPGE